MSWTNWYLPIGCPHVSRSRAYSTDRSRQARITPHAPAATVKRPWSSPYMAISNPWPSSPTRFSAGTSTFSKKSSPVEPAQTPSLCSVSVALNPGMPFSSRKAEIPLCFADGSVVGDGRVRDPVLRAVQDVDVGLAPRSRLHRGDVGPCGRLSQPEAREL